MQLVIVASLSGQGCSKRSIAAVERVIVVGRYFAFAFLCLLLERRMRAESSPGGHGGIEPDLTVQMRVAA
jgi:hypothetical protein